MIVRLNSRLSVDVDGLGIMHLRKINSYNIFLNGISCSGFYMISRTESTEAKRLQVYFEPVVNTYLLLLECVS